MYNTINIEHILLLNQHLVDECYKWITAGKFSGFDLGKPDGIYNLLYAFLNFSGSLCEMIKTWFVETFRKKQKCCFNHNIIYTALKRTTFLVLPFATFDLGTGCIVSNLWQQWLFHPSTSWKRNACSIYLTTEHKNAKQK